MEPIDFDRINGISKIHRMRFKPFKPEFPSLCEFCKIL